MSLRLCPVLRTRTALPATLGVYGVLMARIALPAALYGVLMARMVLAVGHTDGGYGASRCGGKRTERKRKGLRWCAAPMRPWFKALATPRRGGAESSPIT